MPVLVAAIAVIVGLVAGLVVARSLPRHRTVPAASGGEARELRVDAVIDAAAIDGVQIGGVLDGHPAAIVVADAEGRIGYRNVAASAMSGTHMGALLDAAVGRHLEAARSAPTGRETLEFYGPPRTVFEVWARALPGGGSVAFADDVSERRRLDQVRTDFVANISHELRTPIGALSVLAETIADETDQATIRRIVARMLAESDRATRTIDDLIELSRIEAGTDGEREPVSVADVIDGAIARAAEAAAQRRIAVTALDRVDGDGHRHAGMMVSGDRRELISAVGNLVENAVKYSDADATVQLRASRCDGWVEIAVIDHGIGIPQRDLGRVFERFYRVDRARSRSTGGTGLGLSIVRHVVTKHGGQVTVTSTEGAGSTFVVRLPALEPCAGGDAARASITDVTGAA